MSKKKRGHACKGRHCAWCKHLCGKTIGLGHNGVGYCTLPMFHNGKHSVGPL